MTWVGEPELGGYSRLLWNGSRLGLTFILGIFSVALVTRLGADALVVYLYLLGWRWTAQFVIDATEAAALSRHANGMQPGRADVLPVVLVTAVLLALSGPLGWKIANPDFQLALGLGTLANCVIVGTQISAADRLARWILDGQMGRYNRFLLLRRASEFLALAGAVFLASRPQDALVVQAVFLIFGAIITLAVLPARCRTEDRLKPDLIFRQRFWQSAMLGASTSLAARAPAVILPLFGGAEVGIGAGIMVLLLGYVRQAGSVLLGGLDGVARRRGAILDQIDGSFRPRAALWAMAALPLLAGLWVLVGPFVDLVLPPGTALDHSALGSVIFALRCALLGAMIRLLAEARVKTLSGLGVLGRTGRNALVPTAVYGIFLAIAAARFAPDAALVAAALAYLVLQITLLGIVWFQQPGRPSVAGHNLSPAAPSLPAE